jgi:type IV secretion system protein VirB2
MKKLSDFLAKIALLSFFMLAIAPVAAIISTDAFATATSTPATTATVDKNILVETVCRVLQIVTGSAGKAFAAFAIISIGIGFFTGKVSWGLMIGVAAGIAAMFGAPSIVSVISGDPVGNCDATT